MKIVCAWCGKVIRKDVEEEVSHVICQECYDREVRSFIEAQQRARAGMAPRKRSRNKLGDKEIMVSIG